MGPAIQVSELKREYRFNSGVLRRSERVVKALDGISFQVQRGEVFGLVGPNGAGKTTLIKILTTLLLPTSGVACVLGWDVGKQEWEIRRRTNFVLGGEQGLYGRLSAEDNITFFSDLHRVPRQIAKKRIPELLELVGLWERRQDRVEHFSKGMKQRLHIAKALVNAPEVLLLDEPTIGLDPVAARLLRDIIVELRSRNITIILTSHYMEEMELLCERIAVLNLGRLVALDTPAGLKRVVGGESVIELQTLCDVGRAVAHLQELPFVKGVSLSAAGQAHMLRIVTNDTSTTTDVLRMDLPQANFSRLVQRAPNLEDAYVVLVGSTKEI